LAIEGLDAALDRAEAYLDCGVDALFIEAQRTPAQMQAACSRFAARVPLLANIVEGGKTPPLDTAALQALGFRLAIVPGGTVRAVAQTLAGFYASLQAHGSTAPWKDRMLDFYGLNALIGTSELLAHARRYDGEA
jgi:2-methylisocitrate lyase-like PEP mutase family enzyme